MHESLMAMYRRLPNPVQSVAASLRGLYLRHWRAGPEFERQREEVLDRDGWSAARLATWEDERLGRILARAVRDVPYYARQWAERRRRGDRASAEVLANWPVLEKDAVRADPRAFVATDRDVRQMFREQTSGTTGKPMEIWRSRATVTELYAIAEARTLDWHGIASEERWARLGGQLVIAASRRKPPFWVWNAAMRQLYMSTYHLSPEFIPYYLDALVKYRIKYLGAYTSSLVALAHVAIHRRPRDLRMLAVFTNAEGVDPAQRALIEEAFQCSVRETYGQAEMVAAGSECPSGRLHRWPEVGRIEVMDGAEPSAPGVTGEFICTSVLNPDMPLIRYRVGDRGVLADPGERCDCGRQLSLIGAVAGRTNDLLRTRDGREVFWLNPVFYGLPIRESQIEQDAIDHLIVRIAPGAGYDHSVIARTIEQRLRDRMGEIGVTFEVVDTIPRSANGKLRAILCRVPAAGASTATAPPPSPARATQGAH